MKPRAHLIFGLLTTGLLLGVAEDTQAQMTGTNVDEFRQIEQSPALNIAVTAAGLGLMGLELWWFMFSKPKAKADSFEASPKFTNGPSKEDAPPFAEIPKVPIAINLHAFYNGIEMADGVLIVEEHLYPRFSPSLG